MPLEGSTLERGEQIEDRGVKMENSDWRVENVRMEFYSLLCHHSILCRRTTRAFYRGLRAESVEYASPAQPQEELQDIALRKGSSGPVGKTGL